ncbi:universal stress protein [Bifidobacterium avesanii]|uniref:Universal stress protein n=3 Tax=Bifidobacterium avesanii TaxID=1798157 RepID=A0A7K3TEV3_9BIFI|nr:universal stress protein [Bifidobacterium avesanii]
MMTQSAMNAADIVVGVDGSDESFAALKFALKEAAITGQKVNAVFGWTHSWDMGAEPDDDESWSKVRREISATLREWVEKASTGIEFDPGNLELTSVKATGTSALLQIGANAQQIVVGRRSLGRVARWFMGSLSASLAEESKRPVTVVRILDDEAQNVQDAIANALTPVDAHVRVEAPQRAVSPDRRPVVVGVDGSETSAHALDFAIHEAATHQRPLHVMFCWQLKDLGVIEGYENAIAPIEAGQRRAEEIVNGMVAKATIPEGVVSVEAHAFHIPAAKGLISASRYASWLVVGSRGLSGLDAHFLGSVSKQIVNFAECTVTVVH